MSGIPGSAYYGIQYQSADPQRSADGYTQPGAMEMSVHNSMQNGMILGGQSLDEIISQNNQEIQRRRTFQPPYRDPISQEAHARRASMMEFGAPLSTDLADFQFDPNPATSTMEQPFPSFPTPQKALEPRKVRSRENLAVDTTFSNINTPYTMYTNSASYASNLMSGTSNGLDSLSQFDPQSMDYSMDYENASGEATSMNTHHNPYSQALFTESPMDHNFPLPYASSMDDPGGPNSRNDEQELIGKIPHMSMVDPQPNIENHQDLLPVSESATATQDPNPRHAESAAQEPGASRQSLKEGQNTFNQPGHFANSSKCGAGRPSLYPSPYSSGGFDMLNVLLKVASRPNPEINIGPVDLSCAFVVCDIQQHDLPIVYCSDVFERLTGYSKYEILGRNCRFLQAPDGKVQEGVKRKYVDDTSIMKLKKKINKRSECQTTIINYRKGGQAFTNLLTVIPVPWDTAELKYYVGFQVDLVAQPNSVRATNPDGSYVINYQRGQIPRYVLQLPETKNNIQLDIGQTIGPDEVSTVLSTLGSEESDLSKRIWDRVLLENTDDVVHVLSLKGLFLYLSPACRKVLEYDASELVGTPLSSVCHPSDIVPVTRELKETSSGAPVNVVFRIRRKRSGYTWFESYGCLHTEQGKGRKCIILVGRQRPVYALAKSEITTEGEIGESEVWTKISTSGMFLYVSSNLKTLLDRSPEDLIGTSIQALMRPESKRDFGRSLEQARVGQKAIVKHDLQHRRGHVLRVQTSIYPGDAEKGKKATFLVAQTRFIKMTRASLLSQKPHPAASPRTDQASSIGSATSPPHKSGDSRPSTPRSSHSFSGDNAIATATGGTGLALGNQDEALSSGDNIFDELKTTRSTSWQFELRQMEKQNRLLAEELQGLLSRKKKRKRRKGMGQMEKDCANCHTRVTPEWRRGPSGNRDLCNSCGLRWAKQNGRVSPRKHSDNSDGQSASPSQSQTDDKTTPVQAGPGPGPGAAAPPLVPLNLTAEQQTSPRPLGTRPPKIDEGQEPPHDGVLPT